MCYPHPITPKNMKCQHFSVSQRDMNIVTNKIVLLCVCLFASSAACIPCNCSFVLYVLVYSTSKTNIFSRSNSSGVILYVQRMYPEYFCGALENFHAIMMIENWKYFSLASLNLPSFENCLASRIHNWAYAPKLAISLHGMAWHGKLDI